MLIKRIFDICGPNGYVPNGWNWNYVEDLWNHNSIVYHEFINDFNKKYGQVSVYDCNLNLSDINIVNRHISDIKFDGESSLVYDTNGTDDSLYLYTIHPFGSVDTCIGENLNYHQHTHCFDFISELAKKYVRTSKNFYIVFDYSSEGDIKYHLFENLQKKCSELNIPHSKVIIITASMNTRSIYSDYLNDNPSSEQFYTAHHCWPLLSKQKETSYLLTQDSFFEFNGNKNESSLMQEHEVLSSTNRDKKCLILNRRIAPHRVIILSLLLNDNLLDSTLSSFDLGLSYSENLGLDLVNGTGYNRRPYIEDIKYKSNMVNGFFKLNKIHKRSVDYDDIEKVWGFGFENKKNYLDTYFSVITETIFYEDGHYISEKTFKGISHLHPFVIVGKPGILKYLKKLGFKTFSDFWDESYDEIENNSERLIKIYTVIKSLIEKSNEEWDELNKKLFPILKHNREHLLSFDETDVNNTYIKNLNNLLQHEPNQENYFLF